jgi:excisionase family DNA binding protein
MYLDKKNELLKVAEVAGLLKVSPAAVYSWIAKGKIPSYKLVGVIRLKKSDLEEWFRSRRKG